MTEKFMNGWLFFCYPTSTRMITAVDSTKCYDPTILFRFQKHLTLPDLPLDESTASQDKTPPFNLQEMSLIPDPLSFLQTALGESYTAEVAQEFRELVQQGTSLQDLIARAESIKKISLSFSKSLH